MPPVKIQVPQEVENDTAIMSFVNASQKVINEFSDKMENVATKGKDLINKKEEDMSLMEKIRMTKLSVQFMSAGTSLVKELEKIQRYIEKKQIEGVSKKDMQAYEAVQKALEKRINALNIKYKNIISD
ncbi:MAG: hypothetical protein B7C24_17155 [Bacteroidetes bacterium 4572_77]|nr:MAG: hypothetical protein B7C24_17155 [Bacteroidetes bacterium 4572_77]